MLNLGLLGGRAAEGPLKDIVSPVPEPSIVSGAPSLADGGLLVDLFRDLVEARGAIDAGRLSQRERGDRTTSPWPMTHRKRTPGSFAKPRFF